MRAEPDPLMLLILIVLMIFGRKSPQNKIMSRITIMSRKKRRGYG